MKITSVRATAVEVPVTRIAAYSKRTITPRRQHHRRGGDRRRDLRSRRGTGRVLRAHRQRAARAGGGGASRGGPSRDPRCVPAGRALRLRLPRVPFRSKRLRRHRDSPLGHRRPRLRPAALPASGRTGPGSGSLRRLRLHGGPGRGSARGGDRAHHGRHRGRAGRRRPAPGCSSTRWACTPSRARCV